MSSTNKVVSEKVLSIVREIVEVIENANGTPLNEEETSPKKAFMKHLTSPMMENAEYRALMELSRGCPGFTPDESGEDKGVRVANISECKVTLQQAINAMPNAVQYVLNTSQLMQALREKVSFPKISYLSIVTHDKRHRQVIGDLRVFPDLEFFYSSNAEDLEFAGTVTSEALPSSLREISLRMGGTFFAPVALDALRVHPKPGAEIRVNLHVKELLIDVKECEGDVFVYAASYDRLFVLNPHPKAFVEVRVPKESQGDIKVGKVNVYRV